MLVIVGKSLADGNVEVRDRKSGSKEEVPVGSVVSQLINLLS